MTKNTNNYFYNLIERAIENHINSAQGLRNQLCYSEARIHEDAAYEFEELLGRMRSQESVGNITFDKSLLI